VTVEADVSLGVDVEVGPGARLLASVKVHRAATIGANAIVRGGVVVGRGAVVEPGALVDSDVPAYAVVSGSPARIVGYADLPPEVADAEPVGPELIDGPTGTAVRGVTLYPLTSASDLRGRLAAVEFAGLPFVPRRLFSVYGVPDESVRGAHAHRECSQLLVCVAGAVSSIADDGRSRQEFRLTSPAVGLLVPPMVWGMQYRFSPDAVLIVLAELPYDPGDYIRDYEEFRDLAVVP
jgi:dTDP-4-dehydrorhamnose 3,5-epimerase-like enzyme